MQEPSSRQKQIIDISMNIISKRGIQELTMKNLSLELGISEPAIYRHFESKQKILIAVLDSFKNQNKLINESVPLQGETSLKHLQDAVTKILKKFSENPAISAVIFSEEIFQNQSELSEMVLGIMNANIKFFSELIQKGIEDKSIRSDIGFEELGAIVLGSVRQLVTVWRLSGFTLDLNGYGKKLLESLELMIGI